MQDDLKTFALFTEQKEGLMSIYRSVLTYNNTQSFFKNPIYL